MNMNARIAKWPFMMRTRYYAIFAGKALSAQAKDFWVRLNIQTKKLYGFL